MINEWTYMFKSTDLLEAATRYYLGRQTAAAADHARRLRIAWDDIPANTKKIILKDMERADEEDNLGGECDRKLWHEAIAHAKQWDAREGMHKGDAAGYWHLCTKNLYMEDEAGNDGEIAFVKGKKYLCTEEYEPRRYGEVRWSYFFTSERGPRHEIASGDDWHACLEKCEGDRISDEELENLKQ